MSDELAPCPFCGGKAQPHENDWCEPSDWSVYCETCSARAISDAHDRQSAIAAWNRRAPPQPPPEPEIAELVKRLRKGAPKTWADEDGNIHSGHYKPTVGEVEAADALERLAKSLADKDAELDQCASWLTYLTRGLGSVTSDKVKAWLAARQRQAKETQT